MASRRNIVFVYEGLGAEADCVERLTLCLSDWAKGTEWKVEKIHPEHILRGKWQERTALMAFPGGFDKGFLKTLGDQGQKIIREYVLHGGSYLGICAGGYFASTFIEFDKGGPLQVVGARNLNFFPGDCVGPVFPGFEYATTNGAHAALIDLKTSDEEMSFHAYFNGGGKFVLNEPSADVQVVGSYGEFDDKPAALVLCRVGRGRVLLSGVHWEFRGCDLDAEDPNLKRIIPPLKASEHKRKQCVGALMKFILLG